jgi:hypothetical protein
MNYDDDDYYYFITIITVITIMTSYIITIWTGGGYLLQTRRTLDRIQDHDSRIKDTDPSLGSRLALYGAAYRRAMTEHYSALV